MNVWSGLREMLDGVQRFCGYKVVETVSPDRLRWLANKSILKHVLCASGINCVLDVGANRGQYGKALRDMDYRGWICSFEPVESNLAELREAASRDARWRVFPFALGAADARTTINVTERTVFSSFLEPRTDSQARFPTNRVLRTEQVEIRRLDDVFDSCLSGIEAPRVYLKMDTQGFDLEVVKGARAVLERVEALQTEVSFRGIYSGMPGFVESIEMLRSCGFDVVDFLSVTSEAENLCAIEMDCVMARRVSAPSA